MEVLLRAVHEQFGVTLLLHRTVAAQLGEVCDQLEEVDLVRDRGPAGGDGLVPRGEVGGQAQVLAVVVAVEAEHPG